MDRRTKIIATIGPASRSNEAIHQLLKAGVNIARLNLSHGTHAEHKEVYERLRAASEELKIPVSVLLDLQGPKIRIGNLPNDELVLAQGQQVTITTRLDATSKDEIPVDFAGLQTSVKQGETILLDDGNLELRVESVGSEQVHARVVTGGILKSHKGISLPDAEFDLETLTEKDVADLDFGLALGVDAIALSFVKSGHDIQILREKIEALSPKSTHMPIIAKLERKVALNHLDEIIDAADGVMVARGDLGVEMSPQEVPIAQKKIIDSANRHSKLVITATQMLESMIHNPRPTRAEASDVANAIFDGTDAVMLSGETAVGEYPVESVKMMGRIICKAEAHVSEWGHWHGPEMIDSSNDDTVYMSMAVRALAHDRNVAAVAVFTMSGRTALFVSKTRPEVPILAFTPDRHTYHRIEFYWGVTPYLVPQSSTLEEMITDVDALMKASGVVNPGQQVVLTCGFPVATVSPTNLLLLHTIKE